MKTLAAALRMIRSVIPGLGLGMFVGIAVAQAQTGDIGDVARGVQGQLGFLADLLGGVAFFLGVALAVAGVMKLKQNAQNPNDPSAKLSTGLVYIAAGAAMVAIPTTLGVGVASFFGDGANLADVDGTLRTLR